MRWTLSPGAPRAPMSARKLSKLFHRSHTLIPSAPCVDQLGLFGLLQRWSIAFHAANSGVLLRPWVLFIV